MKVIIYNLFITLLLKEITYSNINTTHNGCLQTRLEIVMLNIWEVMIKI